MSDKPKDPKGAKPPYEKPKIVSEPWLVNGAAITCNGTLNGGRKDALGAPNFCRSNRLLS